MISQDNNSAVVLYEPQVQVYNAQPTTSTASYSSRSYASGAAILAAVLTYVCIAMFFWWAIFFTVIAWIMACVVSMILSITSLQCILKDLELLLFAYPTPG